MIVDRYEKDWSGYLQTVLQGLDQSVRYHLRGDRLRRQAELDHLKVLEILVVVTDRYHRGIQYYCPGDFTLPGYCRCCLGDRCDRGLQSEAEGSGRRSFDGV